jgi:hypothetical protein
MVPSDAKSLLRGHTGIGPYQSVLFLLRHVRGTSAARLTRRGTASAPGRACRRCPSARGAWPRPATAEALQGIVQEQPGQGERREPATDVRLDGDEMAADADDGDAGHATAAY